MIVTAIVALALAIPSDPFVRSRVKPGTASDHCLYWTEGSTLVWRAESTGNPETPGDTEFDAFQKSFDAWNTQLMSCGSLLWQEGSRTSSRKIGWEQGASATNENVLLFRFKSCSSAAPVSDTCWDDPNDADDCGNKWDCWEHQAAAIALTTTTYDPKSGRILDADVEFNSAPTSSNASFLFSTVDSPKCVAPNYSTSCVAWDIENTLTHEIGHMMGLDHTLYTGSTMNPTAPPGETTKRALDTGTQSFVCAVYPSGQVAHDCVIPPVTGKLGDVAKTCGGCSSGAGALAVAALLALRRRKNAG